MKEFKIDAHNLSASRKYLKDIETIILDKSNNYGLMSKFTTGFGWYGNLLSLDANGILRNDIFQLIIETHKFFSNLYQGKYVFVKTWNHYVMKQREVISYLK